MTDPVGYLDRWSARPGDRIGVHLASAIPTRATVDLVRLGRGNERAEPDGIVFEAVAGVSARVVEMQVRSVDAGSWAELGELRSIALGDGTLAMLVQPWIAGGAVQTVLSLGTGTTCLRVVIDSNGEVVLCVGPQRSGTGWHVVARRWLLLRLHWSASAVELLLVDRDARVLGDASIATRAGLDAGRLLLAGRRLEDGSVGEHFDGRLERPVLWSGECQVEKMVDALLIAEGLPPDARACWDFCLRPDGDEIVDVGPRRIHGHVFQGPKRAVRGARWRGNVFDWRADPIQYGAIHFHRDDVLDAGWPESLAIDLPAGLSSGAYAVRVRCEGQGRQPPSLTGSLLRLPLFVRPAENRRARIAVLFSTYTYLAYGNDRCALLGNNPEVLAARAIALEPTDVLLSRHPEWGLSLYDTHVDGSGVSLASRRRPLPGLQPDQRAWQAGEGSGRWNYPGDLLLVEWLEREGIHWDALTDEDLHDEGIDVLAPYRVVLTGTHPEYATPRMVESLRSFMGNGGRLMYLGGNGFYWRIACAPGLPGVIELRRAEDGNRSWAEEPGEYYHAFDGGYGGLWRRNGLAPQSWLGVGYAGQGFRRSVGYLPGRDAGRKEAAFVFEGVEGGRFGASGVIGGACAGVEVDRFDEVLGSDPHALWLATSETFDDTYLVANEEMLVTRPTISATHATGVRADVVLQATRGGGAVFSTGSIAWIGGLAAAGGDRAVKRMTRNVLDRFLVDSPITTARRADGGSDRG